MANMSKPDHYFYTVEIRFSDEDGGYIATASALPGCSAFGKTRTEAATEIEDAMLAWIEAKRQTRDQS